MRILLIIAIITACAGNAIAQQSPPPPPQQEQKEDDPNKWGERLGLRIGYVGTSSGLENSFGGGVNVALHWVQSVHGPFGLSFALGAFALGSTDREDITIDFFGTTLDDVNMRIINFSFGPSVELPINERMRFHASIRGALYTVTLFVTQGLNQGDPSDNHLGANGTAGLVYRLSTNWFLDLDMQLHKIWTSSDPTDIIYAYSEGEQDPLFYVVNVGVMLRLF